MFHSEPHDILKFATMETKAFIKDYVRKNIVNHKVDFGNDAFKVKGFKVHQAKHTIRRDEFDDYGVDPDTQSFITIEFWDAANEIDMNDCIAVILTINGKGLFGTASAPYDFDLDTVDDDWAIEFAEQLNKANK